MGPTDGASGLGMEKPGQAFQIDLWMTHKPLASHIPTQSHDAGCPCGVGCRSCLLMQENRKWKLLLPLPRLFSVITLARQDNYLGQ